MGDTEGCRVGSESSMQLLQPQSPALRVAIPGQDMECSNVFVLILANYTNIQYNHNTSMDELQLQILFFYCFITEYRTKLYDYYLDSVISYSKEDFQSE